MAGFLHFISNRNDAGVELFYRAANAADIKPSSNIVHERRLIHFRNLRAASPDELNIDHCGFTLRKSGLSVDHVRAEAQKEDAGSVGQEYKNILADLTGADHVFIFATRHRVTNPPGPASETTDYRTQPALAIHSDYTVVEGQIVAFDALRENGIDPSATKRIQCINIWRPLNTNFNPQLGIMDMRSVQPGDVATIQVKDRHDWTGPRSQPVVGLRYSPGQDWCWIRDQQPEDLLILKQWDSRDDVTRMCPHGAYYDIEAGSEGVALRESFEARLVAVHL